jgi:hypothetical protein
MLPISKRGLPRIILLLTTGLLVAGGANAAPRFDPLKLKRAEVALRKEKWIADLLAEPGQAVEWQIGMHSRGGREFGYGEYVCLKLRQLGVYDDRVHVRIVNIDYLAANPGQFRDASLGQVACKDGEHIYP